MIQQMTVHICQVKTDTYQSNTIWYKYLNSKKNLHVSFRYDDETNCNGARSMLIYQWASYSSISTFRITDGKNKLIEI